MKFSQKEIEDLLISWVVLSVAFAIFRRGIPGLMETPVYLVQMSIIVGTGFVLHELSHKYMAQRYGLWAEYRKWNIGLAFAFVLSLTRAVLFAAPGAVMIMGTPWTTPDVEAKTSLAGPVANMIVGITALFVRAAGAFSGFMTELAVFNFFLATFNLIPIPPMDGSKVMKHSIGIWGAAIAAAVALLFVAAGA